MLRLGALCTLLKLLLVPAAYSTDLDVHRHWKSLVWNLPLSQWYTDESSQWTLDYPPLFAYFEYALATLARLTNPDVLRLGDVSVASSATVAFLRASVMATDVVLYYGVYCAVDAMRHGTSSANNAHSTNCEQDLIPHLRAAALVIFAPGLILVDNIHFQYNGLPLGVLLISISHFVREELTAAVILFAIAVNTKHTLLPLAPMLAAHTVSILAHRAGLEVRCWRALPSQRMAKFVRSVAAVGSSFIVTFLLPWMPLLYVGGFSGLRAALHRLFPFGRGLLHSYWAPNFWAVYAALDKVLVKAGFAGRIADVDPASGRIGAVRPFRALLNVSPGVCMRLVISIMVPWLTVVLLRRRHSRTSVSHGVVYAALCAFLLGWHVHEKAVLLALVPFAASLGNEDDARIWAAFALLATGGQFGLFPLITSPGETAYKILHYITYCSYVLALCIQHMHEAPLLKLGLILYFVGTWLVEVYSGAAGVHERVFGQGILEFLPLSLVSVYSSAGVIASFLLLGSKFYDG